MKLRVALVPSYEPDDVLLDVVKELFKYTIKESDIKKDNWYKH